MGALFQAVASQLGNLGSGLGEARAANVDQRNQVAQQQAAINARLAELAEQKRYDDVQQALERSRQDIERQKATPTKYQHALVRDPSDPDNPKVALFNPTTGQYLNPDTMTPILDAHAWEKPPKQPSIQEQLSAAVEDAMKRGIEPTKDSTVQRLAGVLRSTHPSPQEPGSYIPIYDTKSGALKGFYDPKSRKWQDAPPQTAGANTGAGNNAEDRRKAYLDKQVKPYQDMLNLVDEAHDLAKQGGAGNAEADVGLVLNYFKIIRGAQGSQIRFTRQEQDFITGARSFVGSLEVKANKVTSNGEPLSQLQRQQLVDVIDTAAKGIKRRIAELTQSDVTNVDPSEIPH